MANRYNEMQLTYMDEVLSQSQQWMTGIKKLKGG